MVVTRTRGYIPVPIFETCDRWLYEQALPFWAARGFDPDTGTAWEALTHAGQPRADIARRLRVQARQSYCFATSGRALDLPRAEALFRFTMQAGFDPISGNLVGVFDPHMAPMTTPHDLYDLAFVMLAAGGLAAAGVDVSQDLDHLEQALARLKADQGWFEDIHHSLPRRQNSHMHLFEAAILVWNATKRPLFKAVAQECLTLFKTRFLQPNGQVLEYFNADWSAVALRRQAVEPGHMAEWVYLIDLYETVFGTSTSVDLDRVFQGVRTVALPLLPDAVWPLRETRRLWPQTEYLKAALVMRKHGALRARDHSLPERILSNIWDQYLDVPCKGGWFDQRSANGALVSDLMPSSSFYHILGAIQLAAQKAPAVAEAA